MKKNLEKRLSGFSWEFPGTSDTSYARVLREIQNDTRLSQKRKDELIEEVTYLVGHILNDVDTRIRHKYGSAHSSGTTYLKFTTWERPSKWIEMIFFNALQSVYATSCLQSLNQVSNIIQSMKKTLRRYVK